MTIEDQNEAIQQDEIVEENEESQSDNSEAETDEEEGAEEETLVVSIGEESPDEDDTALTVEKEDDTDTIRQMRKALKEKNEASKADKKRLKELEAKEAERSASKDKVELGDKPNRDDYEYDQDDKFETDLVAWHDRKRKHETKKQADKDEVAAADERWHKRVSTYDTNKAALKVDDFEEVEERVKAKFSVQQHAIAIHALDKPELFVLAVGNNQKILDQLSEIKDPVKFAVEIGKIEAKLKTTKRKAPAPETRLKGTAAIGGSSDKTLAKLEREAAKNNNDRTKIVAYKKQLKEAS